MKMTKPQADEKRGNFGSVGIWICIHILYGEISTSETSIFLFRMTFPQEEDFKRSIISLDKMGDQISIHLFLSDLTKLFAGFLPK